MRYSVEQIEEIVRAGAPEGANRSDMFHALVGHYLGCGWDIERIWHTWSSTRTALGSAICARAGWPGRLHAAPANTALPLCRYSTTPAGPATGKPSIAAGNSQPIQTSGRHNGAAAAENRRSRATATADPKLQRQKAIPDWMKPTIPICSMMMKIWIPSPQPAPDLPPMYAHGDPDPRPLKSWLVKGLIPACGHGLLSGQWGTYKSFVALELATALMTAQPFLGRHDQAPVRRAVPGR